MEDRMRLQKLAEVFYAIYHGKYGLQMIRQNQEFIDQVRPSDVIRLVDMLIGNNIPMSGLKTGISKFLSVVYKPLLSFDNPVPAPGSLRCAYPPDRTRRAFRKHRGCRALPAAGGLSF